MTATASAHPYQCTEGQHEIVCVEGTDPEERGLDTHGMGGRDRNEHPGPAFEPASLREGPQPAELFRGHERKAPPEGPGLCPLRQLVEVAAPPDQIGSRLRGGPVEGTVERQAF